MGDIQDVDGAVVVVDSIDDPIGFSSRPVTARQWTEQRLAHPVRIVGKVANAELEDSRGDRFWQPMGNGAPSGALELNSLRLFMHRWQIAVVAPG